MSTISNPYPGFRFPAGIINRAVWLCHCFDLSLREIALPTGGQSMTFRGQPYLLQFALPNFYFHLATAYAILRHNGIVIGKRTSSVASRGLCGAGATLVHWSMPVCPL